MMMHQSFSFLLLLTSIGALVEAFVPRFAHDHSTTRLHYNDDRQDPNDALGVRQSNDALTIPVLGPFPGKAPLMIGAELTLTPPTPMQWQTLEEAVWQHQKHLKEEGSEASASIAAAPLVAIMDDYTTRQLPGHGRYATIAAVVGMSTQSTSPQDLDMSDDASFMESVTKIGRKTLTPLDRTIRLVGIGRASLHNFFYRVPSAALEDSMDAEGYFELNEQDEEDDDDDHIQTNIVMASFQLLKDLDRREIGGRQYFSSPVHAINEMSTLANKINRVHEDRRRLVAGLQAAKARLQFAGVEELEDYDGLGMLMAQRDFEAEMEETQPIIDQLLQDYSEPPSSLRESSSSSSSTDERLASREKLAQMENYGMGYSASSISNIRELTKVWSEKLEAYHSPATRESEEHFYEILSFVSMLAMDKYLEPRDMGWALCCTNTIERLEQAYEWMWTHARMLRDEVEIASQELRDCGEECTDLW